MTNKIQDLSKFKLPDDFRGKSAIQVQIWWIAQASIFKWSPQFAYKFRASLLRMFGAKIGKNTVIRPSATITYPWKVHIDDNVWIGDDVVLYSLGEIHIGKDTVISQRSYICAADHDYRKVDFPIRARPIHIGSQCWIATDTFIAPGINIGDGVVIGARSTVTKNMPAYKLCLGSPCKPISDRISL